MKWLHFSHPNGITSWCLPLEPLQNLGDDSLKILPGEEVQWRQMKHWKTSGDSHEENKSYFARAVKHFCCVFPGSMYKLFENEYKEWFILSLVNNNMVVEEARAKGHLCNT